MQRYFIQEKKENHFQLDEKDSYHVTKVMRMEVGETIEVVYENGCYLAKITSLYPQVEGELLSLIEEKKSLSYSVTLAQSIVKEQKMDWILQKSTELGVQEIIPTIVERSIVKVDKKETKKKERWQRIVKEASEQSKRTTIPIVQSPMTIQELSTLKDYDVKLLCTTRKNTKNLKKILSNIKDGATMIIVIGPEGGFTQEEEEILIRGGFETVSLGDTILRTETASLFFLSAVRYHDMR